MLLDELDDAAAAAPEAPEDDEDDAEPAPALSSSKFRNEDGWTDVDDGESGARGLGEQQ